MDDALLFAYYLSRRNADALERLGYNRFKQAFDELVERKINNYTD